MGLFTSKSINQTTFSEERIIAPGIYVGIFANSEAIKIDNKYYKLISTNKIDNKIEYTFTDSVKLTVEKNNDKLKYTVENSGKFESGTIPVVFKSIKSNSDNIDLIEQLLNQTDQIKHVTFEEKIDSVIETVVSKPVVSEQCVEDVISESVVSEPDVETVVTEPVVETVVSEPVVDSVGESVVENVVSEPVVETVVSEPVVDSVGEPVVETVVSEPVVETVVSEPVVENVVSESVKLEPIVSESVVSESVKLESVIEFVGESVVLERVGEPVISESVGETVEYVHGNENVTEQEPPTQQFTNDSTGKDQLIEEVQEPGQITEIQQEPITEVGENDSIQEN
jgi:hypothetical protein